MQGCFDGAVPPVIATCSTDGVPHATYLSQLTLVDDDHVALSNQFWSKTTANLADNPRASVLVTDSQTYETYRLALCFERRDTDWPSLRAASGLDRCHREDDGHGRRSSPCGPLTCTGY